MASGCDEMESRYINYEPGLIGTCLRPSSFLSIHDHTGQSLSDQPNITWNYITTSDAEEKKIFFLSAEVQLWEDITDILIYLHDKLMATVLYNGVV